MKGVLQLTWVTFGAHCALKPNPSITLDGIYSTLLSPSEGISFEQPTALLEIAKLDRLVFQQALAGDSDCGYFLAELLAFISKNQGLLRRKNEAFRRFDADWKKAHATTSKQPPLRKLIHDIVSEAKRTRWLLSLRNIKSSPVKGIKPNKPLLDLPDLDPSPGVMCKWLDVVVYPRLRSMAPQLRNDPQIGNMRKLLDQNGKFQMSKLEQEARKIVARLAALPRPYYFDIS